MPPESIIQPVVRPSGGGRSRADATGAAGPARLLHVLALGSALSAAAAFTVAETDGQCHWRELLSLNILHAALTIGAAWTLRRTALHAPVGQRNVAFRSAKGRPPRRPTYDAPAGQLVSPLIACVLAASLAWEPLSRWWLGAGRPFEWIVMFNLKNVTLALAAAACWLPYQRLALLAALFLSLFACATTTDPAAHALTAANAVCGVLWLCASHWASLQERLISGGHERRARHVAVPAVAATLILLGSIPSTGNQLLSAARGFLPSSGGAGRQDPYARGGVGDGDALVAGTERVTSFAPIEDAPFIADEMPALYDIFNDSYEPPCPSKHQDRAVSLSSDLMQELQQRMARSEQSHRQFSTLRQNAARNRRALPDIPSDALMHVAGRTPLHLRLQLYDIFDGIAWHPEPEPESQPPLFFELRDQKPWLCVQSLFAGLPEVPAQERHVLKVVRLRTNRIPSPVQLTGVHIDLVDRLDLFGWSQHGIVQMQRKTLPAGVPIHIASRIPSDHRFLRDGTFFGATRSPHVSLPGGPEMANLRRLAAAWTADVPRGWAQVEAVTRRLREEYSHDPGAAASPDSRSPVADFLFRTRRGPDYQFATAAALLLRSLGYPTRVVSGFYARPDKYDPRTRHTPVHTQDVHFWVEVQLGADAWATVDPTPGYEVLRPPLGISERLLAMLLALGRWSRDHWLLLSTGTLCALALHRTRLSWLDALHTLAWRWSRRQSPRRHVLATWRLLDRRLAWAGLRRPRWCSPGEWCRRLPSAEPDHAAALLTLARWADWAMFAPLDLRETGADADDVRADCRSAVERSKLRRLRQMASDGGARVASHESRSDFRSVTQARFTREGLRR